MIFRSVKKENGIALLMTLAVTALVVTASLELNRKVRSAVITTAVSRNRLALSQTAAAGIHAAMALLVKDKLTSQTDSLQEDWADPEIMAALLEDLPFDQGKVAVKIEDELGKIQINALVTGPGEREFNEPQREVWDRLLSAYMTRHEVFEDMEPATIIDALKDWLDAGDDDAITGLNGAESDYYEDLDPPYFCRNGAVKYKAELIRLKGMSPELYGGIEEVPGLSRFLTVYGHISGDTPGTLQWDGKINLNTADLSVIAALLPPELEDLAEVLVEFRQEKDGEDYVHDLSNPTWYKTVPGFGDVEIEPELITVVSDIFRITATASLDQTRVTTTAVVRREQAKKTGKWTCRVLSWDGEGDIL